MFGRPTLAIRIKWRYLPSVLEPLKCGCRRAYNLRGVWPDEWVNRLEAADHPWKYMDLEATDRHLEIYMKGYHTRAECRDGLVRAANFIDWVRAQGAHVEVL